MTAAMLKALPLMAALAGGVGGGGFAVGCVAVVDWGGVVWPAATATPRTRIARKACTRGRMRSIIRYLDRRYFGRVLRADGVDNMAKPRFARSVLPRNPPGRSAALEYAARQLRSIYAHCWNGWRAAVLFGPALQAVRSGAEPDAQTTSRSNGFRQGTIAAGGLKMPPRRFSLQSCEFGTMLSRPTRPAGGRWSMPNLRER